MDGAQPVAYNELDTRAGIACAPLGRAFLAMSMRYATRDIEGRL
jgi:hypothetical protein